MTNETVLDLTKSITGALCYRTKITGSQKKVQNPFVRKLRKSRFVIESSRYSSK